jgi:hypothetical protein
MDSISSMEIIGPPPFIRTAGLPGYKNRGHGFAPIYYTPARADNKNKKARPAATASDPDESAAF